MNIDVDAITNEMFKDLRESLITIFDDDQRTSFTEFFEGYSDLSVGYVFLERGMIKLNKCCYLFNRWEDYLSDDEFSSLSLESIETLITYDSVSLKKELAKYNLSIDSQEIFDSIHRICAIARDANFYSMTIYELFDTMSDRYYQIQTILNTLFGIEDKDGQTGTALAEFNINFSKLRKFKKEKRKERKQDIDFESLNKLQIKEMINTSMIAMNKQNSNFSTNNSLIYLKTLVDEHSNQNTIALNAGISSSLLSSIINGTRGLKKNIAIRLCFAFNFNVLEVQYFLSRFNYSLSSHLLKDQVVTYAFLQGLGIDDTNIILSKLGEKEL